MKKYLLFALFLSAVVAAQAQERKWEHQFHASAGVQIDNSDDTGSSTRIGYSLGYFLKNNFSVTAGASLRYEVENMFESQDGADDDDYKFADVAFAARYHTGRWTLGLGPVFSFCTENDTYYIDANPLDPMNGKKKLHTFGFGMQPSVMYSLGRHFRLGLEGRIGLNDMRIDYGRYHETNRFHCLWLTLAATI